jgi:hypothetical protein
MNTPSAALRVRPPAVAGRFYPADAFTLARDVDAYVRGGEHPVPAGAPDAAPKALIVPHAGYVYSGPVAGAGYAELRRARSVVERVVLLGPAHYVPVRSIATTGADVWRTPLGDVPIDTAARRRALAVPGVVVDDEAHAPEHSLEVHLPFLQRTLGEFRLVPFVVGRAEPDTVAALLDALWGGPETLVVVSSDLSHYLDHDTAVARDRRTADAIVAGAVDALDPYDACGAHPVRGLLVEAARRGLHTRVVSLCNSGDTAGPRDRVVGYGAFALEAPVIEDPGERQAARPSALAPGQRAALLQVAVATVAEGLLTGDEREPEPHYLLDPDLGAPGAAFVTLERDGQLLGCVGGLDAVRPLALAVARGAYAAAFEDPRLPPVDERDFVAMSVKVSVLSELRHLPATGYEHLLELARPAIDGLVVRAGRHQATLLPSVWRQLSCTADFVGALWNKAGLAPGVWPTGITVHHYTTDEFSDPGPRLPLT